MSPGGAAVGSASAGRNDALTRCSQASRDGRIGKLRTQFPLHATVVDPARFAHEGQRDGRQSLDDLPPIEARRPREGERIGHRIEVVAHLHVRIVADVIHTTGERTKERQTGQASEIHGMDVVGMDIVFGTQHRITAPQPVERQAVGRIDARRAQHRYPHPCASAKSAQTLLCIDPAPRTCRLRPTGPQLVHPRTCTIAVNPCRAYVYEGLW